MDKYRVKTQRDWFIPQFKMRFLPIYLPWKHSHQGGGFSAHMVRSEEEAKEYIRDHIKSLEDAKRISLLKTRIIAFEG